MVTTWWKNGMLLYDGASLKTENNSLIIQNTSFEDEGSYSCKTVQVYEFGEREQIITFDVEVIGKYPFYHNQTKNASNYFIMGFNSLK